MDLEFMSLKNAGNATEIDAYASETADFDEYTDTEIGSSTFKQSRHPIALSFHYIFKLSAVFMYIFGNWLTDNFVLGFVICILLVAFDFWTVKNVSGRLLVGLRWWNYIKEDGSNVWVFESLEDMTELSPFDSKMFWAGLYASPILWLLLFVICFLRLEFEYLPIAFAALSMNLANCYGYYQCSNSAKEKIQHLMRQGLRQGAIQAVEGSSSIIEWLFSILLSSGDDLSRLERSTLNRQEVVV